jgi:ornithine cyclodeaminase/alanine dehydrogenase-like protein (mu-crystallin family)
MLDGPTMTALLPMSRAIEAIWTALAGGLEPDSDPDRTIVPVPAGQLLLMPSVTDSYVGVKLASVAPKNVAWPRVQGVYVLLNARTLTPVALLDGVVLTSLRTPAVSAVAVLHLAPPEMKRLLVFGTGPQAEGHIAAIREVRPIEHVDIVGRRASAVNALVARLRADGLSAASAAPAAVVSADIICCCTTARSPLFDSTLVRPHATVVAVGSHEPDARELDEHLITRSTTVVESVSTAMREAGDIIQAGVSPATLATLASLVRGDFAVPPDRPRVFKSTGMAWQDLVVATAIYEAGSNS